MKDYKFGFKDYLFVGIISATMVSILVYLNDFPKENVEKVIINDEVVGTWRGALCFSGVTMLETYEFESDGKGSVRIFTNGPDSKISDNTKNFTWNKAANSEYIVSMDGQEDVFELKNGILHYTSALFGELKYQKGEKPYDNSPNVQVSSSSATRSPERNLIDVEFGSSRDVYMYLNSYKFVSQIGSCIHFDNNGRTMYGDGVVLATNVEISSYSKKTATMKVYNLYGGRNMFTIYIKKNSHYIKDDNGGMIYEETSKWQ